MILFLVNKQFKIADLVFSSGISQKNFWFEYFMMKFTKEIVEIEMYDELIPTLQVSDNINFSYRSDEGRQRIIVHLKEEYGIDGEYFDNMKIFALEKSIFNMDFTKIKSRKIKIIEV